MKWVGVIAFVLLSMAAGPGSACSISSLWRPQTFMERLERAPIVFRGNVTGLHDLQSGPSNMYGATIDVDCVYKGIGLVAKRVTMQYFGFAHGLCTSNRVTEGKSYVIFATSNDHGDLSLYNVNVQSAATEATPQLIADVEAAYSCTGPQ